MSFDVFPVRLAQRNIITLGVSWLRLLLRTFRDTCCLKDVCKQGEE